MKEQTNNRTAGRLLVVAVAMFGFGYLLVPIYDLLCDVTGLNGKTQQAELAETKDMKVVSDRIVEVEFTTQVNTNLPWKFKSLQGKMDVHPGKMTTARFLAKNLANEVITAQAIPSVAPGKATKHLKKIECFCFTQQTLQPGEEKEMTLQFMVDNKLAPDVDKITLAYSFFNSAKKIKTGFIKQQSLKIATNDSK